MTPAEELAELRAIVRVLAASNPHDDRDYLCAWCDRRWPYHANQCVWICAVRAVEADT